MLKDGLFLPGDYVCRFGDEGKEMYFIYKGECSVIGEDMTTVYKTLSSGDYFGELSLLTGQKRTAYVRADLFCTLAALNKDHFDHIMKMYPQQLEVIISQMTDGQKLCMQKFYADHNAQFSRRPSYMVGGQGGQGQSLSRRGSNLFGNKAQGNSQGITIQKAQNGGPANQIGNSDLVNTTTVQANACYFPLPYPQVQPDLQSSSMQLNFGQNSAGLKKEIVIPGQPDDCPGDTNPFFERRKVEPTSGANKDEEEELPCLDPGVLSKKLTDLLKDDPQKRRVSDDDEVDRIGLELFTTNRPDLQGGGSAGSNENFTVTSPGNKDSKKKFMRWDDSSAKLINNTKEGDTDLSAPNPSMVPKTFLSSSSSSKPPLEDDILKVEINKMRTMPCGPAAGQEDEDLSTMVQELEELDDQVRTRVRELLSHHTILSERLQGLQDMWEEKKSRSTSTI